MRWGSRQPGVASYLVARTSLHVGRSRRYPSAARRSTVPARTTYSGAHLGKKTAGAGFEPTGRLSATSGSQDFRRNVRFRGNSARAGPARRSSTTAAASRPLDWTVTEMCRHGGSSRLHLAGTVDDLGWDAAPGEPAGVGACEVVVVEVAVEVALEAGETQCR